MAESITVEGRCFRAQSSPQYRHVWSVYDQNGKYVESFGGNREAAQARIAMLDAREQNRQVEGPGV